ncbi:SGNH/GDSL hydrolase family protein [Agromyces sp. SYSU K20354]|uniref:SGNH/GDSL hydrolase family protein n=1 Tax=Agromyces cavernae TaxID=2898659 RepID=UPI001E44E692|nr:SGNH/GDSL hydrolase family protein [Agromyces cavernae]MCD2442885.1 SGNH/GDSL hydrolase family protein [Agromyces cavernae]
MIARGFRRTTAIVVAIGCLALTACTMPVTSAPGQAASPSAGQVVAAFYGDSYTRGTGASSPERRWSTIVSAGRGWFEFNPSVDGIGYVSNRDFFAGDDLVDQIVDHEPPPDVVIVTMGLNDNFVLPPDADDIESAIEADLTRFRAELPDARLVVVEPFWHLDERPESVGQIIGWVESAAALVGADYIDGASRWIEGHPEWMSADTVHPNDDGYAEIARRMDQELERLGL